MKLYLCGKSIINLNKSWHKQIKHCKFVLSNKDDARDK